MTVAARFGIREDYVERPVPAYTADDAQSGFQPHAYDLAVYLAELMGFDDPMIVDIGCGKASKLLAIHPSFRVVGIDTGENLEAARVAAESIPSGWRPAPEFFDIDLETIHPERLARGYLAGSIMICADVIEHLVDPTNLLVTIRTWMEVAKSCILTTPERVLCYGADHRGPPPNPSHVREWTRVELERYLRSMGLEIKFSGLTQTHIDHPETGAHQGCQTILMVLGE